MVLETVSSEGSHKCDNTTIMRQSFSMYSSVQNEVKCGVISMTRLRGVNNYALAKSLLNKKLVIRERSTNRS